MSFDYPEWFARAACRGVDPDLFHPSRGESTASAKEICGRCEIRVDCLDWAVATGERFGIWGGASERERRMIRTRRRLGTPEIPESPPICACCGVVFRPRRKDQRFCTADCRLYQQRRTA